MKTLAAVAAALLASLSFEAQAVGRMADISIYDRTTGRTLPVYWQEGRAYVVGKPGNEYQIVARNRRGEDLLAVVSVDAVNVLTGHTASPEQGGYVLGPRSRTDIKGWRKNLNETAAFYFTSLGDSYAGRTDRPEDVGVIGVALFERAQRYEAPVGPQDPWGPKRKEGQATQPGEPRAKSFGVPGEPLGTGHGVIEQSRARATDFERASDNPLETIVIYYDSYRNLVAQGVIGSSYGQRQPQPFPGAFVPDPPRYRYHDR